jgi:hypothetical protein
MEVVMGIDIKIYKDVSEVEFNSNRFNSLFKRCACDKAQDDVYICDDSDIDRIVSKLWENKERPYNCSEERYRRECDLFINEIKRRMPCKIEFC